MRKSWPVGVLLVLFFLNVPSDCVSTHMKYVQSPLISKISIASMRLQRMG